MSTQYLSELKTKLVGKLPGYRFVDRGSSLFSIMKDNQEVAIIKDAGEYVVVTIGSKDFKYDKWYTKPEHLANVLVNYFVTPKQ